MCSAIDKMNENKNNANLFMNQTMSNEEYGISETEDSGKNVMIVTIKAQRPGLYRDEIFAIWEYNENI